MIWYDAKTYEPVAPGANEDGGYPSIFEYYCVKDRQRVKLVYKMNNILCDKCRTVLLTRG